MIGTTSPHTLPIRFMPPSTTAQKRTATTTPVIRGSNAKALSADSAMLKAWIDGPVIVQAKTVASA